MDLLCMHRTSFLLPSQPAHAAVECKYKLLPFIYAQYFALTKLKLKVQFFANANFSHFLFLLENKKKITSVLQMYLFYLFGADKVSIADCRHASDKKFKTFTFYVPSSG